MIYVKRVFTVIMFILGLAGLLIGTSYIFLPKSNGANSGMEEFKANGILGEKEKSIDVLFLGDSEIYCSVIPFQIWQNKGYTSYVCGTSGQTLDYTEVMLKRTFEKQSPKIVVLETHAIYREFTIKNVIFTKVSDYFSVFRYHNRWKTMSLDEINKPAEYTFTDESKGYRMKTGIKPAVNGGSYMFPSDKSLPIDSINRQSVGRIKKLCDENGAKLVFISTPSTKNWNYMCHNGIEALAKELSCEYIDLNLLPKEVPIDWNHDTVDKGDHMNCYGAQKVTLYMSNYLENTGLLTDKRNDPDYKTWNDAAEVFDQKFPK